MGRFIAIDGNSLMHRAYWAIPGMTAKNGAPTGAVYGFLNMLLRLLDYSPEYMAVGFDMHAPTFRHEQYKEYKAGRKPTPDDLRAQFPIIKRILGEMGITVVECEGFEADDIIGTYARMANEAGHDALIVTGDRDTLQLVNEHIHVLSTKKGVTDTVEYDPATLFEQYGIPPERMSDLKGLMGDQSDNLPGIPGVGEKTAIKLLQKYGSMEETLNNAANETGALGKKLAQSADSARMSYALGLIDTHAPVPYTLAECVFLPSRMRNALPLLHEYELRSLIKRLPEGDAPAAKPAKVEVREPVTVRVDDTEKLSALMDKLKAAGRAAFHAGQTLFVAADPDTQYEIVLGATLLDSGLSEEQAFAALKPILEDEGVSKLAFDTKKLLHMAARNGAAVRGPRFDAMIADYLLHAIHPADTLDTLCGERLSSKAAAAKLFLLEDMMQGELEHKGLTELYRTVELPLVEVLFDMEREGFAVDADTLRALQTDFDGRIKEAEAKIYEQAGENFNILSTRQLGTVLFEKLKLPPQKKTKSGFSTDSEVLEAIADMHPIVKLVQEYRFLSKLKSTFLDGLIAMARNGRVHTSFNQNVTATGRISSTEPNLQNIPVRTEQGREIRRAFVASEGHILVGADYSQIELRLLAHMSGDERMIAAFLSGDDIHARTASEVFSTPLGEVTREQRSAAKAVNFGIVYGISDFGLARNLGIPRKQAADYIERYFERYTGVHDFMKKCVEEGRRAGYACTLMGRRRELPEITSSNYNTRSFGERVAMNMPIQGTAADIIKLAMVRVHERLKAEKLKAKLVLQIHDELIIDTPFEEEEQVKVLLSDCMKNVMQLKVPLLAEVSSGHSWYDTK